jgi:hypothetical protein
MRHPRTYVLSAEDCGKKLYEVINGEKITDSIIIYFSDYKCALDYDSILNEVIENTKFAHYEKIMDSLESGTNTIGFLLD